MGKLDEYLEEIVEWNNFTNLLEEYSIKLEKDSNSIEDPNFIMHFFINELFQGTYYYEKNYTVKYYTVLYKTPMSATFQGETVEFYALSVTYDTISNRFILYLKNGDELTPYIINEYPTQFLQLYDQVDINTNIEG